MITLAMLREDVSAAALADALDGLGYRNQSPRVQIAPVAGQPKLVGRCKTTRWSDLFAIDQKPYELELKAVDTCRTDDVIICAADGSLRSALWGELLSTAAKRAGAVGAIVDGATRDIAMIRQLGFSVFARGTSVYDSLHRQRVVEVDAPVEIDGVRFCPGDLVIADHDGVVVVPQQVEQQAIEHAWNKSQAENKVRDAIAGGMSAGEAYQKYGVL